MGIASGRHFLNGKDLYDVYGILVQSGSAAALAQHKRKAPFSVNYSEVNGAEYDLSKVTYEDAQIPVELTVRGVDGDDLFAKKDSFLAEITQPGWQEWEIPGNRETYLVFYNDVQSVGKVTKDLNTPGEKYLKFTLLLTKKAPDTGNVTQALALVVSHTDVTTHGGNNGTIEAQGFGGSAVYNYQLNNGNWTGDKSGPHTFTNLVPGSKDVKVRDAANVANEALRKVYIAEPLIPMGLSLKVSKKDVSTFGGTDGELEARPSGGTLPYSFKLDTGVYGPSNVFPNLGVGDYTVWVKDATGAEISRQIGIIQPGQVLITPVPPTMPITNDAAKTWDFKPNPLYPNLGDMEQTLNGGTTVTPLTAKPIQVTGTPAAGQVGVRVKAIPGVRAASAWLFNNVGFTTATAAPGNPMTVLIAVNQDVHEVGSVPTVQIYGEVQPNGDTSVTGQRVLRNGSPWRSFTGNTFAFTDAPMSATTYTVEAIGAQSGTKTASVDVVFDYMHFFGPVSALPTTGTVRALAGKAARSAGETFTLETGNAHTRFALAIAPGKTLDTVYDRDTNMNVTRAYDLVNGAFTAEDAQGNPLPGYRLYLFEQSVPYSESHSHETTLL